MVVPEVLSVREFRAGLAATIARVAKGAPAFVGAHRKPEVVVMSVEQYEAIRSNETDLEEWQSKSIDEYQEAQFQRWPHLMERAPTFGNVLNEVVGNVPNATGSPTSQGAYSFQERQS